MRSQQHDKCKAQTATNTCNHHSPRGGPFPTAVWSLTPKGERIPAAATLAFKKGTAELALRIRPRRHRLNQGDTWTPLPHRHRIYARLRHQNRYTIRNSTRPRLSHEIPPNILPINIHDSDYESLPAKSGNKIPSSNKYPIVGVGELFDMEVHGWQNYSANGFCRTTTPSSGSSTPFGTVGGMYPGSSHSRRRRHISAGEKHLPRQPRISSVRRAQKNLHGLYRQRHVPLHTR